MSEEREFGRVGEMDASWHFHVFHVEVCGWAWNLGLESGEFGEDGEEVEGRCGRVGK